MADDEHPGISDTELPKIEEEGVLFHYIKSQQFRTIHVDGAIGAVTPKGLIHCAVFSERPPIPQVTFHKMNDEGHLSGKFRPIKTRPGYIRELDVNLILNYDTALRIREWLDRRIKELESRLDTPQVEDEA